MSTTYEPKAVSRRRNGFQPAAAALTATTISFARTRPCAVSSTPSLTFVTRVRSCTRTEPSATRRRVSASRAGWTVAPSRRKTPSRKTGELMRPASSARESGTASSGTPSSRAASTSSPTA